MAIKKQLSVFIVGGGPVGLALAIELAEVEGIKVTVFERRIVKESPGGRWTWEAAFNRRREQVVTIQDNVKEKLCKRTQGVKAFIEGERVWNTSSNVEIRGFEDSLLELAQDLSIDIQNIPATCTNKDRRFNRVNFQDWIKTLKPDILVAADGGGSLTRRAFEECFAPVTLGSTDPENLVETDHALGISLLDDQHVAGQTQALNTVLTLAQNRYLLNSQNGKRGYLNIRITRQEARNLKDANNGKGCAFAQPATLHNVYDHRKTSLITNPVNETEAMLEGLSLFGLNRNNIRGIVYIPITPTYAKNFVHVRRDGCAMCVVGDAAMSHHFWPGRGLNSGLKGAIALSKAIKFGVRMHHENENPMRDVIHHLYKYDTYMQVLRLREMQGRSASMLRKENELPDAIDNINQDTITTAKRTQGVDGEYRYSQFDLKFTQYVKQWRNTMESNPSWPHKHLSDERIEVKLLKSQVQRPRSLTSYILEESACPRNVSKSAKGWPVNQQRGIPDSDGKYVEDVPADQWWTSVDEEIRFTGGKKSILCNDDNNGFVTVNRLLSNKAARELRRSTIRFQCSCIQKRLVRHTTDVRLASALSDESLQGILDTFGLIDNLVKRPCFVEESSFVIENIQNFALSKQITDLLHLVKFKIEPKIVSDRFWQLACRTIMRMVRFGNNKEVAFLFLSNNILNMFVDLECDTSVAFSKSVLKLAYESCKTAPELIVTYNDIIQKIIKIVRSHKDSTEIQILGSLIFKEIASSAKNKGLEKLVELGVPGLLVDAMDVAPDCSLEAIGSLARCSLIKQYPSLLSIGLKRWLRSQHSQSLWSFLQIIGSFESMKLIHEVLKDVSNVNHDHIDIANDLFLSEMDSAIKWIKSLKSSDIMSLQKVIRLCDPFKATIHVEKGTFQCQYLCPSANKASETFRLGKNVFNIAFFASKHIESVNNNAPKRLECIGEINADSADKMYGQLEKLAAKSQFGYDVFTIYIRSDWEATRSSRIDIEKMLLFLGAENFDAIKESEAFAAIGRKCQKGKMPEIRKAGTSSETQSLSACYVSQKLATIVAPSHSNSTKEIRNMLNMFQNGPKELKKIQKRQQLMSLRRENGRRALIIM